MRLRVPVVVVSWLVINAGLARPGAAQSLAWTADSGEGLVSAASRPLGPASLAVDGVGNTFALSLANNGTQVGLLVKYSVHGYQVWNRIEREGWPMAVAVDSRGRPAVLTPIRTLAYDADGGIRWRADHVAGERSLEASAMTSAPGDHVLIAGIVRDGDGSHVGLMRLDEGGRVLWLRTFDTPSGEATDVDALGLDRSGRAYVAGRRPDWAQPGLTAFFLAAFASDGAPLWLRTSSATTSKFQGFPAVMGVDAKGGASLSLPGWPLVAIRTLKFDADGATLWSSEDAPVPGFNDGPTYAAVGEDGSVYVQGVAWDQAVVTRHDAAAGRRRFWDFHSPGGPGGLVVGVTGRIMTAWSEPGAVQVIAYEPSGDVAGSSRTPGGGRLPPALSAGGLVASPSGGARLQVRGEDDTGGSLHLVMAFGPTAGPDWAEVGWPYDVPTADWAASARFDVGGNALVLVGGHRDRVVKYDASGRLLWAQEPWSGTTAQARVLAFAVGPSGESLAAGVRGSAFPLPRVAKLDAGGSVAWLREDLLTPPYDYGEAKATVVDPRGAVYVAGYAMGSSVVPRLFLCKYSADGQLLWRRFDTWAPVDDPFAAVDVVWPILLTKAPGDRIVVGGTVRVAHGTSPLPNPSPRIWVVDGSGADVWAAMLDPQGPGRMLTTLAADSSGAVVAGSWGDLVWGPGGPRWAPGCVYRLGPTGAFEWARPSPSRLVRGVNALMIGENREITVAYTEPCAIERLSASGEQIWWKDAEYPRGSSSWCVSLAPRRTGGFFVVGGYLDDLDSEAHGYVAAYSALGQVDWARDSGPPWGGSSAFGFLDSDPSGRVLVAGYAYRGATDYEALVQVIADEPPRPLSFYTVPPCRAFDSRGDEHGGPLPLSANTHHELSLAGRCGVPPSARAVAANLTAVAPTSAGHITAFPAGRVAPSASVLAYGPGATRASHATLALGDGGKLALHPIQASGALHMIIDVAGYYE